MSWPTSQDYFEAVQNPRLNFGDAELRLGKPRLSHLGLPRVMSGSFADVYPIECPGDRVYAVKCFTREVLDQRERYRAISDYLQQVMLPFTISFSYLAEKQGIRIKGRWYPILKMEWIEGVTLNQFVKDNAHKPDALRALERLWVRLAIRLRESALAHADLQHGNVLLVPVPGALAGTVKVKLIDYDGMFVPALANSPSGELGHANFQHPMRFRKEIYSAELDLFPHLVICAALRCLTVGGRELWNRYDNGDNILFRQRDFEYPGSSPLIQELWKLSDPAARALVGHLILAARGPLGNEPHVGDLLGNGQTPSLTPIQQQQVNVLLSLGAPPRTDSTLHVGQTAPLADGIVVACICGKRYLAQSFLSGKTVGCPDCGRMIHVAPPAVGAEVPLRPPVQALIPPMAPSLQVPVVHNPVPCSVSHHGRLYQFLRIYLPLLCATVGIALFLTYRAMRTTARTVDAQVSSSPSERKIHIAVAPEQTSDAPIPAERATAAVPQESRPTIVDNSVAAPVPANSGLSVPAPPVPDMPTARSVEVFDGNYLKMQLVWCAPGEFEMGSPLGEQNRRSNESPVTVTLTRGFWLGKYEVTQEQFRRVVGKEPWKGKPNVMEGPRYPATYVNWYDADEFCRKVTEHERASGRLVVPGVYRLPTEAEWQYACRAGSRTRFCFGDDETQLGEYAWYGEFMGNGNSQRENHPHTVGGKTPNRWGLHDMHGNVVEWCLDVYGDLLPGGIDPQGPPSGLTRVAVGGGWNLSATYCRASYRDSVGPMHRDDRLGFRVVLDMTAGKTPARNTHELFAEVLKPRRPAASRPVTIMKTQPVGPLGGVPFEDRAPREAVLTGFNVTVSLLGGHGKCIRSLQPIYRATAGEQVLGREYGRGEGKRVTLGDYPGYAVQSMSIRSTTVVKSITVKFGLRNDTSVGAPEMSRTSVVGDEAYSANGTQIGGNGRVAIGIFGRHGFAIDQLGLVTLAE